MILSCNTMSLFASIKSFLLICQFSGLAPFSMNQSTLKWEPNPSLKVISILHIIYNAIILLIIPVFHSELINYSSSGVIVVLYSLLLLLNNTHAMFALLELYTKRDQQVKLLNSFQRLDVLLKQHLNQHIEYGKLKSTCRRIIIVWASEVSFLIICSVVNRIRSPKFITTLYLCLFYPSYILSKLSCGYAVFLVRMVHENLDVMNRYIKSINKQNGYYIREKMFNRNSSKHRDWNHSRASEIKLSIETLHSMKSIYGITWEAIITIRSLLFWSLILGFSNDFVVLTFNLYWFATFVFLRSYPITSYLVLSVLIATNFGNLLFIAHNCSKLVEAVSDCYARKHRPVQWTEFDYFQVFRLQSNIHKIPVDSSEPQSKLIVRNSSILSKLLSISVRNERFHALTDFKFSIETIYPANSASTNLIHAVRMHWNWLRFRFGGKYPSKSH